MIRIPRIDNRVHERFSARVAAPESPALTVKAAADGSVDMLLYDEIGFFGVSAKDFTIALAGVDAKTINLHINSPGGDVFDGIAMHNALKRHPANVIVTVDALAASAASIVAMAGDEVHMAQGSFLMVHRAWTIGVGNSIELKKLSDVLADIDVAIADVYAARTGRKADTMMRLMDDETWLDAQEAVDEKFADTVLDKPAAKAAFDLSIFNHAPESLVAAGKQKKTPRELEAILRDEGGLSRSEAKRAVASARPAALRDEEIADLGSVLRAHRQ